MPARSCWTPSACAAGTSARCGSRSRSAGARPRKSLRTASLLLGRSSVVPASHLHPGYMTLKNERQNGSFLFIRTFDAPWIYLAAGKAAEPPGAYGGCGRAAAGHEPGHEHIAPRAREARARGPASGLRAGSDAAQIRIPVLTRRLQFRVFTFWIVHGALYLHLVCFCNEVGYIV